MTGIDPVLDLLASRQGHFLLESGHHGDLWLDLDALFWQPAALRPLVRDLTDRVRGFDPQVVCGPLVGGALLGYLVADALGLPFVPAERSAVPAERSDDGTDSLYAARYLLPTALHQRLEGRRVVVVDDVVNAGSAVRATLTEVAAAGGEPVGIAALLRLGEAILPYAASVGLPVATLSVRASSLWAPADCPLCARAVPLQTL